MNTDREKSFWLSYSDLMTSLFFIMLVLFIISVATILNLQSKTPSDYSMIVEKNDSLKRQITQIEKQLGESEATKEQYESILQLENQFKQLSQSTTLRYDTIHRTFVAKDLEGIEIFQSESDKIKLEYMDRVDTVGRDLERLLSKLNSGENQNYSYLLIIEGNSANDYKRSMSKDKPYNYRLSYDRALALYNRWKSININLRKYNAEIQICGSGLNGINRDNQIEENNKRFVIQIIPKISCPQNIVSISPFLVSSAPAATIQATSSPL